MTIGIYILRFPNTCKVYIGQSINIEHRFVTHLYKLKKDEGVPKLQKAYIEYGTPSLEILIDCKEEELNILEDMAIEIFNSVENGFNTMSNAGHISSLYGEDCGNSKYSNEKVIEVFNYLIDKPELTQQDISDITNVSINVVNGISCGNTHKWLASAFPDKYEKLEEIKSIRRKLRMSAKIQGIKYPDIVSPEGIIYTVDSIRGFAREHGLNYSCLGQVLRKSTKIHRGWKLA